MQNWDGSNVSDGLCTEAALLSGSEISPPHIWTHRTEVGSRGTVGFRGKTYKTQNGILQSCWTNFWPADDEDDDETYNHWIMFRCQIYLAPALKQKSTKVRVI